MSTEPSTFVVRFTSHDDDLLNFQCENGIGEQLCGIRKDAWDWDYYGKNLVIENLNHFSAVFRHQANAEAANKLRDWLDGIMDMDGVRNRKYCIRLSRPTIGLIYELV